jgi:hypothetical protein
MMAQESGAVSHGYLNNLDSGLWILDPEYFVIGLYRLDFYHNASTAEMELVCRGLSEMRKKVKMENSGEKSPGKSPCFYRRFYDRMRRGKRHDISR